MSKNTTELPFTEIVERAENLARVGNNTTQKIRGVVQDVYTREISAKFDWTFLIAQSSLVTTAEYHQGSVTMNTGDTTVIFSSDASVTSAMVGLQFKPSNNNAVYTITGFNNSTSLTISPPMWGPSNLSGASYSIYQSVYALASNFDRFPKPGGVYRWDGSKKTILPETQYANYINDDYQSTATTPAKTRLVGTDTAGNTLVELIPPPRLASVYGVDYIRTLKPLLESTAGTLQAVSPNGFIVSGNTTTKFTEVSSDGTYFFRVDNLGTGSDSSWYRILSIQHDSQLTLAVAFANTSITTGANYTIARAPEMPTRLHIGVLYGALRALTLDQDDPNAAFYNSQYAQVLSDAKKIYVSRPYSQDITGTHEDYRYRR